MNIFIIEYYTLCAILRPVSLEFLFLGRGVEGLICKLKNWMISTKQNIFCTLIN